MLARACCQNLVDKLGKRQWIDLLGCDFSGHDGQQLVDDADALLSELRTDVFAVQVEELQEQSIGAELEKLVAHPLVQFFLLCFQSSDGFFEELVLTVLFFGEGVHLSWPEHDQLVHVLLVCGRLGQDLVDEADDLARVRRHVLVIFLRQQACQELDTTAVENFADEGVRVFAPLAEHTDQKGDRLLRVCVLKLRASRPIRVDHFAVGACVTFRSTVDDGGVLLEALDDDVEKAHVHHLLELLRELVEVR